MEIKIRVTERGDVVIFRGMDSKIEEGELKFRDP